ncbi:hypothetical protein TNCV_977741 [Trichonephila clavipes]|nr:hypothetical protein TNCV_977741 [Trichonephila clavipes]
MSKAAGSSPSFCLMPRLRFFSLLGYTRRKKYFGGVLALSKWYWARTRDKASHGPIPIPLGYRGHQTNIGDDYIAEFSDVFREAINARNIYAAWARKLMNSKPSDPDVQLYHQEVKKAEQGRRTSPAEESKRRKNRQRFLLLLLPLPTLPVKGRKAAKRSVDADGFAPPPSLLGNSLSRSSPPPSLLPPLLSKTRFGKEITPTIGSTNQLLPVLAGYSPQSFLLYYSDMGWRLASRAICPDIALFPVVTAVFVSPKGRLEAISGSCQIDCPFLSTQMSGRFLRRLLWVTKNYREPQSLKLEQSGVEFKSFMLKQDRPVKVVIEVFPPTRSRKTSKLKSKP